MTEATNTDYWGQADGGFRASTMMRIGAIAAVCAVLANLVTRGLAGQDSPSLIATIIAWLLYMAALWLLAGGFLWTGSQPFLGRSGFLVGALHAAQAGYLLVLLFTGATATIPPAGFTIARLLALLAFVWLERSWLNRQTQRLVGGAAGLQLAKVLAHTSGLWPEPPPPVDPILDAATMAFLALALFQLGTAIRQLENSWAHQICHTRQAGLSDFNNPEHSWNKAHSGK